MNLGGDLPKKDHPTEKRTKALKVSNPFLLPTFRRSMLAKSQDLPSKMKKADTALAG